MSTEEVESRRVPRFTRDAAALWWSVVLRGVLAILFGLLTFALPGMTLLTLVLAFGAYAMATGVLALVAAAHRGGTTRGAERPWWIYLFQGVLGVGAGVLAFTVPGLTALTLLLVIAAHAVLTGAVEVVAAVRLRRWVEHAWMLALGGGVAIAFGVLTALAPGAGALALLLWIGGYAVVLGVLLVAAGIRLRGAHREPPGERARFGGGGTLVSGR